jgi:hypothetical protein
MRAKVQAMAKDVVGAMEDADKAAGLAPDNTDTSELQKRLLDSLPSQKY